MSQGLNTIPKLLIVDDDPESLEQMLEWLSLRKAVLYQARSGEQALKILKRRAIDVVVTDWQLPGLSGIELVQGLRTDGFKGPLLICTGFMLNAEHLQAAFEAGANDYLRKPVNSVEFNARLDKSLQLFAQQQELERYSQSQQKLVRLMADQLGTDLQRLLQVQEIENLDHQKPTAYQLESNLLTRRLQQRFYKLMDWSRYRFALPEPDIQLFDVRKLIKSVKQSFGPLSERIELNGGTGLVLKSEPELLRRILQQLVDNALTHTSGTVMLKVSRQENSLRFAVLDEGTELTEGDLDRLSQGQTAALGLSICHDLLGVLGARLIASKRRGSAGQIGNLGSQFVFEISL